jgi:hypothetical protein
MQSGSRECTVKFEKPGGEEKYHENIDAYPQNLKHPIRTFRDRGDWFHPVTLSFGSPVQLATYHPIHGTNLRIYDYLGTTKDRGKTHYVFITEQTSGGRGPRTTGRHWASGAISLQISRDGRYINPAQICLMEKGERSTEIFGAKIAQGENYLDGFRKDLKSTLKHYADDHPSLYEALCGLYHFGIGGDKWKSHMKTIWKLLQFDELDANPEHCKKEDCFLLHQLRMAWKDNFLMTMPPPTLPAEPADERNARRYSKEKVKPSRALCQFVTGRVMVFDPAKHRIEWAHDVARKPLPLRKPQG